MNSAFTCYLFFCLKINVDKPGGAHSDASVTYILESTVLASKLNGYN